MRRLLFFVIVALSACRLNAQLDWTEVEIPMSDGQFLAGDIYLPPDWESGPTILVQTPYWKDLYHFVGLPMGIFFNQDEMDYAMVIVDWRGFFGSADAAYTGSPTRGEDGYDVVEWIAGQEWSDGKIGTWGPSALGRIQYQTAREQPPHLVCMVPQVASPLYEYSEYYHNGAARTEYLEQTDGLGFGTSPLIYANPYYNLLWSFTENANHYPEEITIPTFMIGGWYDHNIDVMIRSFAELQTMSATDVQAQHKLLMGPWVHGGSGTAIIGSNIQGELEYVTAEGWSDSLAFAFFDYHLKDIDNGWNETPAVQYFQMGDDEWRSAPEFPVETQLNTLYLQPDFSMSTDLPSEPAELAFQYDPTDPSPTIGGPTLRIDLDQGPYDQSDLVESRDDILVFTTAELPADADVVGAIKVRLGIKTDVIDTDVAVRLCDVYPDGRSMLVNCGIYRLRFLNGFTLEAETMLIPGDAYFADITLPHTALTFKAGHRIRLDITGSNYPLYNRNMNTGGEMYPNGNGDTLVNPVVASNIVILQPNADSTSFLELPMIGNFPVSIDESEADNDVTLYPNPASAALQLEFAKDSDLHTEWGFYDATGKLLLSIIPTRRKLGIDVSYFANGVYTLRKLSGEGKSEQVVIIR